METTVIVITINEQLKPGPANCRHSCWFSLTARLAYIEYITYRYGYWPLLGTLKMAIIRHRCPVQRRSMWTLHT